MADEYKSDGSGGKTALSVVIVGASGDLAKKKTYPALWELFRDGHIPKDVIMVGYARSAKEDSAFRSHLRPYLESKAQGQDKLLSEFLERCWYRRGQYDSVEAFAAVAEELTKMEDAVNGGTNKANRLFYYAIPPTVFSMVSGPIKKAAMTSRGWNRVVIEKPFGMDLASSQVLSKQIAANFEESEVYRIDHYLGKEMVQNLMVLRFANTAFEPLWNRHYISTVQISFKEPFGTDGRGGYFDKFGIIRDVMQNHLTQVMTLVAMEPPVSLAAEDVRDEKVKVLKCMPPVELKNTVLGQYTADPSRTNPGYLDDPTVPPQSTTPTFATSVMYINNPRWSGVPFILKCGKALNDRKAEIRIQFKPKPNNLFSDSVVHSNELVISIQPKALVYMKVMTKAPGLDSEIVETELDLSYPTRFLSRKPPEAYARLLLDVVRGDHAHFVRVDELNEAWRVFTPLLKEIEETKVQPILYHFGSRGPVESDDLIRSAGYKYGAGYTRRWKRRFESSSSLAEMETKFELNVKKLRQLRTAFINEMRRGLKDVGSTIKMIPSHVTTLPTGTEQGEVWAMDLGGTNCRVVKYPLLGDGRVGNPVETKAVVPASVKGGVCSEFMDWLVDRIEEAKVPDGATLGFTFSFPVQQTGIASGSLIHWTKGWTTRDVPGKDIVKLLQDCLRRRGRDVNVAALVNDTVGTLVAKHYSDTACKIGVILGTGTNACYVEKADHVDKWPSSDGIIVINTEWGGFGSGTRGTDMLPLTEIDLELDEHTARPTSQRFEKMISGETLGEIFRLCVAKLEACDAIWTTGAKPNDSSILRQRNAFSADLVSQIVADESKNMDGVAALLRDRCGLGTTSLEDRLTLKRVAVMVGLRAARLSAMAIAAVASQIDAVDRDAPKCHVGIDGSVYLKFTHFRAWMVEALSELDCNVRLFGSQDGSGQGAGLIALGAVKGAGVEAGAGGAGAGSV